MQLLFHEMKASLSLHEIGMVSTREAPPAVGGRSVVVVGVDVGRSVIAIVGSAVPLGVVVGESFVASGQVDEVYM